MILGHILWFSYSYFHLLLDVTEDKDNILPDIKNTLDFMSFPSYRKTFESSMISEEVLRGRRD